jgi:hypothetical protein
LQEAHPSAAKAGNIGPEIGTAKAVPFQNNDDSPDIESPYSSFLAQISNAIALQIGSLSSSPQANPVSLPCIFSFFAHDSCSPNPGRTTTLLPL